MSKLNIPIDIQDYISDNPEFSEILKSFGETMETYNKTLEAMGLASVAVVSSRSTSTADELEIKSSSTKDLKLAGS